MKPKNIVANIAKNSGYYEMAKLWSSENGDEEHLPSKRVIKMFQILSKRIDDEKKSLLRSFGLRPRANVMDFKVPRHVQAAKDEFDGEVNRQMPVFIQVMNKTPIQLMNFMPIQAKAV